MLMLYAVTYRGVTSVTTVYRLYVTAMSLFLLSICFLPSFVRLFVSAFLDSSSFFFFPFNHQS